MEIMNMKRLAALVLLATGLNGCGGYYILSAPDQLTVETEPVNVVVRLQRNDMFVMAFGVKEAAISFRAENLSERAAYTDDLGYAGAVVPAPSNPGLYALVVKHNDIEGEEISATAPLYVWPKDAEAVVIELEALPAEGDNDSANAAKAIRTLIDGKKVIYLTRKPIKDHNSLHDWLGGGGYPDGPVFLWQRKKWHLVQGRFKIPKIIIESRLISQLPEIVEMLPNTHMGVCKTDLAAKTFREAGIEPLIVKSWQELAEK